MDDVTRRMLQEAYALDDIARAEFERHQWQMQRRSGDDSGLVYKTYGEARTIQQPAQQQDWSGWDRWVQAHLRAFAQGSLKQAIGYALSEIRHQLRTEFSSEIAELRKEVTKLRDDPPVAVLIDGKISKMRGQDENTA